MFFKAPIGAIGWPKNSESVSVSMQYLTLRLFKSLEAGLLHHGFLD